MTVIQNKTSVCAWLKSPSSTAEYPTVFAYGGSDFYMRGNGRYHKVAFSGYWSYFPLETPDSVSAVLNDWHQVCLTFSAEAFMSRNYVNGKLIESKSSPSIGTIPIDSSYTVTLGNSSPRQGWSYYGGEVAGLNLFAKELTEEEVGEMYTAGICSPVPEKHEVFISWEEILKQTRSGTVTEFFLTECTATVTYRLDQVEDKVTSLVQKVSQLEDQLTQ